MYSYTRQDNMSGNPIIDRHIYYKHVYCIELMSVTKTDMIQSYQLSLVLYVCASSLVTVVALQFLNIQTLSMRFKSIDRRLVTFVV